MSIKSNQKTVGRVVGIWRYPVKSMAGEALNEVDVSWFGLAGDRRWAFVRNEAQQSDFPWLTIRERSDMQHYLPRFLDPAQSDKSATVVQTPSGVTYDVHDPKLADELYPAGARAIKQQRGVFDTFPISLISTQTIAKLGEWVGEDLNVQRFRPNLLVELEEDLPFAEDDWVGCALRIGDFRMRVDKRDGRCAVITVDPVTTERDPNILRTVVNERQGCLGVYGTTVKPGKIVVGDKVIVDLCETESKTLVAAYPGQGM